MKSLMRHRLMKILKNIDCLLSIHDLLEDVALSFCDVTCFLRQQQFSRLFYFPFPTSSDFDNKVHMFIGDMPYAVSSR